MVDTVYGQPYAARVVEIEATTEFKRWFESLEVGEKKAIDLVVGLLRVQGVGLGAPYSSSIKGARFPLRELRPKRGASPLRAFYAFAPRRNVLLLIGGDKSGDNRFYTRMIARAESLWVEYSRQEKP